MKDIDDLDRLIEGSVRKVELDAFKRGDMSPAERESMLDQLLGPKTLPVEGERFTVGDSTAGVSPRSMWLEKRRIPFAVIVSLAIGEKTTDEKTSAWIDINCTAHRSFRIRVSNLLQADNFHVGLYQHVTIKVVPTIEEQMDDLRRQEERDLIREFNAERRQSRLEALQLYQASLLEDLVRVESAPRVSFGVIY